MLVVIYGGIDSFQESPELARDLGISQGAQGALLRLVRAHPSPPGAERLGGVQGLGGGPEALPGNSALCGSPYLFKNTTFQLFGGNMGYMSVKD